MIILRFILTEVLEGKHGDGGPIGQGMGHLLDGGDLGRASGNQDKAPEERSGNDEEDPCGQGHPPPFPPEGIFSLLHPVGRRTGMGEQPIHPDGLSDVLQGLLPQILVIEAQLALDVMMHHAGDADSSPLRQSLEAGGDVDPVPVDPALFLHHIP